MILQIINYPIEGSNNNDFQIQPHKVSKPPIKLLIQTNNYFNQLRSPKIYTSKSTTRQGFEFNDTHLIKEQSVQSTKKNRFAMIKKVFQKHDEKGHQFLERKLSLLKFNFKEQEIEQKLKEKISIEPIKFVRQVKLEKNINQSKNIIISSSIDSTNNDNISRKIKTAHTNFRKLQQPSYLSKIHHRRLNSDSDQLTNKPNRKQIISYSIRPNTQGKDLEHTQFAQSILDYYIKNI